MSHVTHNLGELKVPVLLIAFRRYEATAQVIETLRQANVPRVYFACDGGRDEKEWVEVEKVRSLVDRFDWGCELETKFNKENKGCRVNPSESISWFFENEEEGIILEDDIIPVTSFFYFCQELLEKYRNDCRVWAINGHNWTSSYKRHSKESYYFSSHSYGAYWGWATWRHSWEKFDLDMEQWPSLVNSGLLDSYFLSKDEARVAMRLFDQMWNGEGNGWDYQLDFAKILNNAVNIIPSKSLTQNVGFGHHATHTFNKNDINYEGKSFQVDFPLIHPEFILVDKKRELYCFRHFIKPPLLRRVKNIIKALIPEKVDRFITKKIALLKRESGL